MTAPVGRVPDIVYGEVPGYRPLELDLYLPEARSRTSEPAPVVVYLHGGGWRRGSRREPLPVLGAGFYERLAAEGFAVAAIDYRLSGEARFPAPLDDVRTAIGWVGEHAADYGLDSGRVFLWGDSAGGHLALLAALTGTGVPGSAVPGSAVPGSAVPGSAVQGVVAWFPVTDLAGLPADVAEAGGVSDPGPESREALLLGAPASSVPDLAREASPVSHASAAAPPVLLMHGAADDMVPPAQSVRLAEALRAAGATAELDLVPGATHMWKGASDVGGIVQRSVEFLRKLS
jgi:acetyl esterase/lipase